MRIITIPCNGCEKCQYQIRSYGCRIKTCNLDDGRNTKTREQVLLQLSETDCETFTLAIDGESFDELFTILNDIICPTLTAIGLTGLFGDIVIRGPLPAFEVPFTIATVQNGVCVPLPISPFNAGEYRLENCGGFALFTIGNSSP